MWKSPVFFQQCLTHNGLVNNDIYEALENDDLSLAVLAASNILKKMTAYDPGENEMKSESVSNTFRIRGNDELFRRNYQNALELYNRALLFAPPGSKAMKLAYNNRSILLFKCKAYRATINDVNILFSIGGLQEKNQQLRKRKRDAENLMYTSPREISKSFMSSRGFFHIENHHREISCASSDVGISTDSNQLPKLTATKDVEVGTLVAVEPPFMSGLLESNVYFACYYCNTFSFNLVPCDQCCFALFCDKNCMKHCQTEYHNIESQIYKLVQTTAVSDTWHLMVKAAIKIKNQSTWKELIEASKNLGINRIKKSSVKEIFDVKEKFSVLCATNDNNFACGPIYNHSFSCAALIDSLETIPTFFPDDLVEKTEAKKALSRILMFLMIYVRPTEVRACSIAWMKQGIRVDGTTSLALYPFAGKLKHKCDANLMGILVKNKLALVAVKPIIKGAELSLSMWGHWLEFIPKKQLPGFSNYFGHKLLCDCPICLGTTDSQEYTLTELQKRCFQNLPNWDNIHPSFERGVYNHMCKALTILADVPFSPEYKKAFEVFRRILVNIQQYDSGNEMIC